eukprot:g13684.t1
MDADKAASLQSTLRQARFAEGEAEREPAGWPSAAKAPGPRFRKLSTGATELPDDDEEREELSPAATDSDEDECPTQPPSRGHPDVGANGLRPSNVPWHGALQAMLVVLETSRMSERQPLFVLPPVPSQ